MYKFAWPILIVLGMMFVLVWDGGNGFSSPGFVLVPIGIVGTIATVYNSVSARGSKLGTKAAKWLIAVWSVTLISFAGLMMSIFTSGFDALIWLFPFFISMAAGIIMSIVFLVRK